MTSQTQLSASHSVLAHAHSIVERAYWEDMASALALLFSCMALSTRISDPEAMKPVMLRSKKTQEPAEKRFTMKQVQRLECVCVGEHPIFHTTKPVRTGGLKV